MVQTSYSSIKELIYFEIDRLIKKETSDAELRIESELANLEPSFDA